MAESSNNDNSDVWWFPLESDPTLFTEYLKAVALSPRYLIDIPSVDCASELGIFEFNEIVAYIFLYPLKNHKTLGQIENDPERTKNLFYMKQLIHNSCGSVALMHAFLNTIPAEKLTRDSIMQQFYLETISKTPEERGQVFASNSSFHQIHHDIALRGNSRMPDEEQLKSLDIHFVAFVPFNGFLYELDGRQEGPINHGETDPEMFKIQALDIIKKYMLMDPESFQFSVLALCN